MAREMKDSGIEWIGEIPKEWEVLKNKNCFTLRKEIVGNSFEEYDLLSLTKLGIKMKDKNDFKGKVPENYGTYQNVKKGELVLCLFDLDCSAVFSGLSKYNGMISPAYKVYNCKKNTFNNFAKYWFEYCFIDRKYKIYSKSLRYVVNSDDFGGIEMAVPSMEEQEKIANYLDKKVANIDLIIEKTKATIEDYKKYKQSIITEAVTKGLNPNVEMKDSGIEWIGEIPKHWKVTKVKNLYDIILGKMLCPSPKNETYTLENYLCSQNIKWGKLNTNLVKKMWFSPEEKKMYLLKQGDLIITEGGSIGESCIYNGEFFPCYIQNAVHKATGKNKNFNKFLFYWLYTLEAVGYFSMICNRATIAHYTDMIPIKDTYILSTN